ncbi:helix-turn-helix domain-containing protein [Streptomyces johnsoniae]|uniref:Helix-turn-helix transcriptional regulator n=1 Tax=Streptomyces johnsoniae TaxID=3075532 RepID=A0ABU2RY88_9ACTN|nr:helix-turn-helix transcriptional regulator [Streptomyces sp. DSM 41886]MDT0441453.1 helix-turn-helix transcriptional regulator [Streptomyces sp. DSM 41886]
MTFEPGELTPDRSARHFYGADLRRHRMNADFSLAALAGEVPCSKSQLARIETAESIPPPGLSEEFDRVFDTDGHFTRLYGLVSREIHPEQYRRHMEIESRARTIREYACLLVPGMLQTRDYVHALFRARWPKDSEEDVRQKVDARLSRQRLLLTNNPPDHSVILDEAVLRRAIGGSAVMRAQLSALIDSVNTPTTVVQVLPFNHGEHALLGGTLRLLTLKDGTTFAYEESIASGTLMEDRERVNERLDAYDLLRSHALPPSETAAFIRSVMEALPE